MSLQTISTRSSNVCVLVYLLVSFVTPVLKIVMSEGFFCLIRFFYKEAGCGVL